MQRITILAVSAVAVLTVESVSAQEVLRGRSGWHTFAPAVAAHHVVTMAVQDGSRQSRTTITRMGNWIREDRGVPGQQSTIFSDVSSGTSFLVGVGDGGRAQSLQINGPENTFVHTRQRSGDIDSTLGETCEIWNMTTSFSNSRTDPVRSQQCVTADGITLWSRTYYGSGAIMKSETAASFERRESAANYVRPPSEVFDWAYWTRAARDTSATSSVFDYQVRLESGEPGESRNIRRHFPWTYTETMYAAGGRSIGISSNRLSLNYSAGGQGSSRLLSIRIGPEQPAPQQGTAASWGPVPLSRPWDVVAGEVCSWFDVRPGVADAGLHECRTWDGITLRIRAFGRAGRAEFTATQVSRRAMSDSDVAPPAVVFDWPR
jgi:hypothetical protein